MPSLECGGSTPLWMRSASLGETLSLIQSGVEPPHSKADKPTDRRGLVYPACHYSKGAGGVESGGELRHDGAVFFDELFVVGGGIDAAAGMVDEADVNAPAQGED